MLVCLHCSRGLLGCLHFFSFFFSLLCSMAVISTILSYRSLICSASVILLFIPYNVFFISVIVLFICLFFSSLKSFLKTFFALSQSLPPLNSFFYPAPWIIITIIILNYFSDKLPIFTSFSCFSGVLSYSFIWDIILCIFISINFLWVWFSFWRRQECSSCFCCLPSGGWVYLTGCASFLVVGPGHG